MDDALDKKILMVAYHFPPVGSSSGVHRTLKFSSYLPEYGWQPLVLTANPRAYDAVSDAQLNDISPDCVVVRAAAFDAARHFSIKGRYPGFFALPDKWVSWWLGGVISGLKLVRKHKPQILFSTYPIATAHLIGLTLHKLTGIPWIADFRDSMTEESYPSDKAKRKAYLWIERKTVEHCDKALFTTPSTVKMYAERYPHLPENKWLEIANGYDEDAFTRIKAKAILNDNFQGKTLVHSGLLYPSERDPRPFFTAIAALKKQGEISAESLRVILRGTRHDEYYAPLIKDFAIDDIVLLEPPVAYDDALAEMMAVDGLLLFQASNCNHQVPAKLYEYFRAQTPIFALTDPQGDTAHIMQRVNIGKIVRLDNASDIEVGLKEFLPSLDKEDNQHGNLDIVSQFSRKSRTEELVDVLESIVTQ